MSDLIWFTVRCWGVGLVVMVAAQVYVFGALAL